MEALITPDVLRWARERSKLSTDDVAGRLGLKPDRVDAWERGEAKPTFKQAQNLANVLRIPFGYLFLQQPPAEQFALPDLRTVGNAELRRPSVDFNDLVNDIIRKHEWYRDYRQQEGAEPLGFVGAFTIKDDPNAVARNIADVLKIDEAMRAQATSWEDFLRMFIRQAEAAGILVMRSGIVGSNTHRALSIDEFRGFAIADRVAPLVFINGRDAKAAQIFTLAHEVAHLWIGATGISNVELAHTQRQEARTERFCNAVAAEVLVPAESLSRHWNNDVSIEMNVSQLVRRYRVSSLVLLRRATEVLDVDHAEIDALYRREFARFRQRETPGEEGGGDFYVTLRSRNGWLFTRAVINAAFEGHTLYRDAARLLGVKVPLLRAVADKLELR
ncbi:Helix-turn-helix domain-containing protein [Bradyrhizobium erythrophlei]|nr:Helix-turn-helix domain-containing protein [Bradyrhizobium erythrophlei]